MDSGARIALSPEGRRQQQAEDGGRSVHLPETQGQAFIFSPQQIAQRKRGTAQEGALQDRSETEKSKQTWTLSAGQGISTAS